eukprot:TRINITY_DN35107_c0_g1_i1.p1 TRINITY_DN35107_c0_g1~~TRINITY_DN35107_c0_g1_i1.p1  ORF type:complete len:224 (+),score=30.14 TRINITY_DN35107_c0_g1_i1:225-896(+)
MASTAAWLDGIAEGNGEAQPHQKNSHQTDGRIPSSSRAFNVYSSHIQFGSSSQQPTVIAQAPSSNYPQPTKGSDIDGHPLYDSPTQRHLSSSNAVFGGEALPLPRPDGVCLTPKRPSSPPKAPRSTSQQQQSNLPYMPLVHEESRVCVPSIAEPSQSYYPQVRAGDGSTVAGTPQRRKHAAGAGRYLEEATDASPGYFPQVRLGDGSTVPGSPHRQKSAETWK